MSDLFFMFKSTVSSEMIGIFGVNSKILFVINSLTFKSPLLTGELSFFILIFNLFCINQLTLFQQN